MSLAATIASLIEDGGSLHIFRDPLTGLLSEELVGLLPENPTVSEFIQEVLYFLDGKIATSKYKGAFSFLCSYHSDMYIQKRHPLTGEYYETEFHFVYLNNEYASTFFSFGGSSTAQITRKNDSPVLTKYVSFTKIGNETKFCEALLVRYAESLPFYNLPQPTGADFEDEVVAYFYRDFARAGCGIGMKYDRSGKLTPRRFRVNLDAAKELGKSLPKELTIFPFLDGFVRASYDHFCDLNLLQEVLSFIDNRNLSNEIIMFEDYFRLLYVSNGVFAQAMGLNSVPDKYDYGSRRSLIFDLLTDKEKPVRRARELNRVAIDMALTENGLSKVRYVKYDEDILSMPPIDLVLVPKDGVLEVGTNNEFWNVAVELEVSKDGRFHPTEDVSLILEQAVYPIDFRKSTDENPEDGIFRAIKYN